MPDPGPPGTGSLFFVFANAAARAARLGCNGVGLDGRLEFDSSNHGLC
jgi:hypothetical protein